MDPETEVQEILRLLDVVEGWVTMALSDEGTHQTAMTAALASMTEVRKIFGRLPAEERDEAAPILTEMFEMIERAGYRIPPPDPPPDGS